MPLIQSCRDSAGRPSAIATPYARLPAAPAWRCQALRPPRPPPPHTRLGSTVSTWTWPWRDQTGQHLAAAPAHIQPSLQQEQEQAYRIQRTSSNVSSRRTGLTLYPPAASSSAGRGCAFSMAPTTAARCASGDPSADACSNMAVSRWAVAGLSSSFLNCRPQPPLTACASGARAHRGQHRPLPKFGAGPHATSGAPQRLCMHEHAPWRSHQTDRRPRACTPAACQGTGPHRCCRKWGRWYRR